ncbi:uncharacterized protein LOC133923173 [Phragmites australis]|uniref:uncharacterized protein LOC133923173 n=1 Tax=Phragmites australis TaxID=29695 RepID=UPI002D793A1D|nr:uncharacterized protein LOC133923173 [Phragmites australis]
MVPYSISDATGLIGSSRTPISVLLDLNAGNFTKWNIFLYALLGCHGLLQHIDRTAAQPIDPVWIQDDCTVLSTMYNCMTLEVLDIILDKNMSAHALLGDLNITTYYKEQKWLANALRDADSPIKDLHLVLNILCGLNPRMPRAASFISMSTPLPSFTKTWSMLLTEEMQITNIAKATAATTLLSSASRQPSCSGSSCHDTNSNATKHKSKGKTKGGNGSSKGDIGGRSGSMMPSPNDPWICFNPRTNTWATLAPGDACILGARPQHALTTMAMPLYQSTSSLAGSILASWDNTYLVVAMNNLTLNSR